MPVALRPHVISLAHIGHIGHIGAAGMKELVRPKVWWLKLDKVVDCYVRPCHGCQVVSRPSRSEQIMSTSLPNKPFQNHFGPTHEDRYALVLIDYYSRYYECKHVASTDAKITIKALGKDFLTHGLPDSLKSDSGPWFILSESKSCCVNLDIEHSRDTPRWPCNNGLAECCMKGIKKRLLIAANTGNNWKNELNKYLFLYWTTSHPVMKKSLA